MPHSKSKRVKADISGPVTSRLELLAAALTWRYEHVAREMEETMHDKLRFEAIAAHPRSRKATLEAIKKVKGMLPKSTSEQEKKVLEGILKRFMRNLYD